MRNIGIFSEDKDKGIRFFEWLIEHFLDVEEIKKNPNTMIAKCKNNDVYTLFITKNMKMCGNRFQFAFIDIEIDNQTVSSVVFPSIYTSSSLFKKYMYFTEWGLGDRKNYMFYNMVFYKDVRSIIDGDY